ncbi:50S ribosome-binding GTPase [Actinoplanes bogorensis]|uniref:50S ribosome-binding GTPase n=1 Tax=Paractinoplanes bogorensis TaxID=1610840 RepID=A0ABS5YUA2_9ACTN|nr:GTPase [Actinoplanes bogorensis]MBU2667027.1 50S ribosome-binding GTPase [Actinoplanes bogorensis]
MVTDGSAIARRIEEALEGRRSHRHDVEAMCVRLATLEAGLGQIVQDVRGLADVPGDSALGQQVRSGVRDFLAGRWGEQLTAGLQNEMRTVLDAARVVQKRIDRDVINLGVVGMMKAGKSTLLRSITGLDKNVIPSEELGATTAALSRIVNDRAAKARLILHTWNSFRAEYLAPLHEAAGLSAAPWSIEEFASYAYPRPGDLTDDKQVERQFLTKLREAQESLPSYRADLGRNTKDVAFDELRPYVAYPGPGDPPDHRPYHAVREVYVHATLPDVPDAKIGLVDLPGSGEAGLKVDTQFLNRLHNDVDLILMVKAPDGGSADMTAADWAIVELAKNARCGVPMEFFFVTVLNQKFRADDPSYAEKKKRFDFARDKVASALTPTGVRVIEANLAEPEEARRDVLMRVLTHLVTHLHAMDQAAMGSVVTAVRDVSVKVLDYLGALLEVSAGWRGNVGDQDIQLRVAAESLAMTLGQELRALARSYHAEAQASDPDTQMMSAVDDADRAVRDWLPGYLKSDELAKEMGHGYLSGVETSYREVRMRVGDAYGEIRPSISASTARLYRDIATVLQKRLTASLVPDPDQPDALRRLEQTARGQEATIIANALVELMQLDEGYGNAVLRVGRPIIRRLQRDEPLAPLPGEASAASSREQRLREMLGQAAPDTAAPAKPTVSIPQTLAELQEALDHDVDTCLNALRTALTAEAKGLSLVLACAVELFADRVERTNTVAWNYERLCRLHRVEVWPDVFGGTAGRTHEALIRLESSATALRDTLGGVR